MACCFPPQIWTSELCAGSKAGAARRGGTLAGKSRRPGRRVLHLWNSRSFLPLSGTFTSKDLVLPHSPMSTQTNKKTNMLHCLFNWAACTNMRRKCQMRQAFFSVWISSRAQNSHSSLGRNKVSKQSYGEVGENQTQHGWIQAGKSRLRGGGHGA